MRGPGALVAALVLWAATPLALHAEDAPRRVVLVLDRGADAAAGAETEAHNALRIWKTLEERGADARLVAAGVSATGDTLLVQVAPTRAGLAALAEEALHAFRGPTDVRAALAWALDNAGGRPVDLILLGPFSEPAQGKAGANAGAVRRWNEKAPEGSRIFAVGPGGARAALAEARGWAGAGRLVVGFQAPAADPEPFTPLVREGAGAAPLVARVRILADVVDLLDGGAPGPVLTASSDVPEDRLEASTTAGLHTWIVRRRPQDGRTGTVSFHAVEREGLHTLAAPPRPLAFLWDRLLFDARLLDAQGHPPAPFAALDVRAGDPVVAVYRLQRTLSGRAPAWRVRGAGGQELPAGLTAEVGREVGISPEVGESEVRVRFAAAPGTALETQGTLELFTDGVPQVLALPYSVRVQAGRATLEVDARPAALPPAHGDAPSTLTVRAANANVPDALSVTASCDGEQARWLTARLVDEEGGVRRWRLDHDLPLPTGRTFRVELELAEDAPDDLAWPCRVTVSLAPHEGVATEGQGVLEVRRRRPRLQLAGAAVTHRLVDGALVADAPIALRLDADGGDGAWLLGLQSTSPVVVPGRDPLVGWQVVAAGPGTWHVVPTGRWRGRGPGIFEDAREDVAFDVTWPAADGRVRVRVPVDIPARWGKRGLLFVILAALALLLALTVLGWMRTPAVQGTLLYTAEGLEGAVGRLDLAPVGRRVRALTRDAKGRLAVAGSGETLARVRPTRVGGMLEYVDAHGARERRLLVDGLSLRIGRHLVRYVSGRHAGPADHAALHEVPDLLGPEYDIEGGRIDALGDDEA